MDRFDNADGLLFLSVDFKNNFIALNFERLLLQLEIQTITMSKSR